MKNISHVFLSFLFVTVFTFSKCKKENEEAQLPPVTTVGAMTFGCKVDGKVFVPRDGRGKPGLFPTYTFLGNGPGGGWYLNIPATNWVPAAPEGLIIGTDSLLVSENTTYEFKLSDTYLRIKGTASANYSNGSDVYPKLNSESGSLFISKFDPVNRILSGTFSFTGTNTNGKKVIVTDGRFDIKF
jgi:hypothetical protein